MQPKRNPLVEAWLASDFKSIMELARSSSASFSDRLQARAMLTWRQPPKGKASEHLDESVARFLEAFGELPADVEVLLILLLDFHTLLSASGRALEAKHAFREIRRLDHPSLASDLRAQILYRLGMSREAGGDTDAAIAAYDEALASAQRGSFGWYRILGRKVLAGLVHGDLRTTKQDLEALVEFPEFNSQLGVSSDILNAHFCLLTGRLEDGLSIARAWKEADEDQARLFKSDVLFQLLLRSGQNEEVRALLTELEQKIPPDAIVSFSLEYALANRQLDEVRKTARSLIATASDPRSLIPVATALIRAELSSGSTAAARRILRVMDPEERRSAYPVLWARLYWTEDNEGCADKHIGKVLARGGPDYLREQLRFAHEVSESRLATAIDRAQSPHDNVDAPEAIEADSDITGAAWPLTGTTEATRNLRDRLKDYAGTPQPVLIEGALGAVAAQVARKLHEESPGSSEPFMAVHCAGFSNTLKASELFGHEKGAFAGATTSEPGLCVDAGKGTLFLEEVGLLAPPLQKALLDMLDTGRVTSVGSKHARPAKVRIVASSRLPLTELVRQKRYRPELCARLNRLTLAIPPLSERADDIPHLAEQFLEKNAGSDAPSMDGELVAALKAHDWRGDVMELEREIARLVLLSGDSKTLGVELFDKRK